MTIQNDAGNRPNRFIKRPSDVQRAYALLETKDFDDAKREFTGIATTPTPDRANDVVLPMGAKFTLPMPFLWQHDSSQPVGWVTAAKPTKDGIPVSIKMATIDVAGALQDRLEEAWQSLKIQLVKGLSIGFRPIKYAWIDETGGIEFQEWDWLELSAVTIPANAEASISSIKSFDVRSRAALGALRPGAVRLINPDPDVSGKSAARGKFVKLISEETSK